MEAAQGLAARVLLETPSRQFDERLDYAYRLSLGRAPSASERERLTAYYRDQKRLLDETPGAAEGWFPTRLEGHDPVETGPAGGGNASAAAWIVNAIPGVCAAELGIVTMLDLPRITGSAQLRAAR